MKFWTPNEGPVEIKFIGDPIPTYHFIPKEGPLVTSQNGLCFLCAFMDEMDYRKLEQARWADDGGQ